jgi:alcohol dehydrogenase, propanol-preferring
VRAYRVVAAGRAELVEVDRPRPGPGEILLRVAATGVCHSDVFIRQALPALGMRLPVTLGHEVVGVVEELGRQVTQWRLGQLGAAYVLRGCGTCTPCRRGRDNLCHTGYRGLGTHFDGGMADYLVVPSASIANADGLDPVAAVPLTDAGLTALHAVNSLSVRDGTPARTLLIGIGGLGHLALQIVAHRGSTEIIAVDRDQERLPLARKLGAHHAVAADGSEVAAVLDLAGGREVDAVLDFAGTESTLRLAAAVTNRGAQIVVAGLGGGTLPFEALSVSTLSPEISLRRISAGSRPELAEVLELGRTGTVQAETVTYPLERAGSAIDDVDAGAVIGRAVLLP